MGRKKVPAKSRQRPITVILTPELDEFVREQGARYERKHGLKRSGLSRYVKALLEREMESARGETSSRRSVGGAVDSSPKVASDT